MARINARVKTSTDIPIHAEGAKQTYGSLAELKRLVSCALLGESAFYVDAMDIEARIRELAQKVSAQDVAELAVFARTELGLRHTPLLLLCLLAEKKQHYLVRSEGEEDVSVLRWAARSILRTPRDAMDLVALYWSNGKKPLPGAFKAAIRDGFYRWTPYQLAKYATLKDNTRVRLRDLMFMSHPSVQRRPGDDVESHALFEAISDDTIRAPDTWEAGLSVPGVDKRAVWERLLSEHKLGALALVRNLRNMESVGVTPALVREAMVRVKATDVWPWQALAAARHAPAYTHDLDALILRSAGTLPTIPGHTAVLFDNSGSMDHALSAKSEMSRRDAAAGLSIVLREVCEKITFVVFSNDQCKLPVRSCPRGAKLAEALRNAVPVGGTDARSGVQYVIDNAGQIDRLIIVTDEQTQTQVQFPGGFLETVVINLAPYSRGIAFQQKVTVISGWSGGIVRFLAAELTGNEETLKSRADPETEDGEE